MRRIFAALALLAALHAVLPSFAAGRLSDGERAQRAYGGLVSRFGVGGLGPWHLAIINGNAANQAAVGPTIETPRQSSWLWQYMQGVNALFVYWQAAPAGDALKADAQARLKSQWAWIKANWSSFAACGAFSGTTAQGMDDATWVGIGLLQLYDATSDSAALQGAADMLSCAYFRWWTSATGGGLVYCDAGFCNGEPSGETLKFAFNVNFGLAMIECADRGCSTGSLTTSQFLSVGKGLIDWANTALLRSGATCHQSDSLLWMSATLSGGVTIPGESACSTPSLIQPGPSVTELGCNLAAAAANAKLSATYGSTYSAKAQAIADSVLALEVNARGIFINDRDARVAAQGFYQFALYADPVISSATRATWRAALLATARSIFGQGALPDGVFRPDWDIASNTAWTGVFHADLLDVGAQQAAILALARKYGL